jgi:hypothetical protein
MPFHLLPVLDLESNARFGIVPAPLSAAFTSVPFVSFHSPRDQSCSISCAKENETSDLYQFIELSEMRRSKKGSGNKKRAWHCHPNYGMRAIGWMVACGRHWSLVIGPAAVIGHWSLGLRPSLVIGH